ncbi:MAG TPA: methyl-accepting chemotaxis protein [bacterium]|nr:methyl-accepting chemotaxis protein [bacterium]HNO90181.1 methyl-accepting chemotaxis protein [bacterium]
MLWSPFLATLCVTLVMAIWNVITYQRLFDLSPDESFFVSVTGFLVVGLTIVVGGMMHLALFRKTLTAESHSGTLSEESIRRIWVEWLKYPRTMVFYLYFVHLAGMSLLLSSVLLVPFVIESISGWEYMYKTLIWVLLGLIPFSIILFYVLEWRIHVCSSRFPEVLAQMPDANDPDIVWIRLRTRVMAPILAMTLWYGLLLYNYHNHPVAITLLALVMFGFIGWLTTRTVQTAHDRWLTLWSGPDIYHTEEVGHTMLHAGDIYRLQKTAERFAATAKREVLVLRDQIQPLGATAEHILSGLKSQNSYASNHASALAQITASLEELMKSVAQISENSKSVNQSTLKGSQEAEDGKRHVADTLQSMEQIHRESQTSAQRILDLSLKMTQIEDVIKIINYITDQTKILAFNAAIETAGAGEMGERFGVVAKEIRHLAQNIADSTEEIKKILLDVRKASQVSVLASEKELMQVKEGIRHAGDARESFEQIYWMVRQTMESVQQIAQAIQQQQSALEQLWMSIKDIDAGAKESLRQNKNMLSSAEELRMLSQNTRTSQRPQSTA